jgi:hypothetical protein
MFFTVADLMITKNAPLDLECFLLDFVELVDEQAVYESSSDDALEHARTDRSFSDADESENTYWMDHVY